MKLPFLALVALAALSLACNLAIPGSNPESPNPTFAAPTAVPTATLTPEPTATPTPAPTATAPFDHSKSGSIERDITYCIVDGIELKMDVYYPQSTDGLWPVAVYVHGGSFTGGNKMRCAGIPFVQPLVDANYLVVSVNYRLAPEHPFPAPIEDVKCAIRSLRANASMYNIDVNHIGVFGGSAGGQLVSMLGVTDASAGMDGSGGYVEQSSRVQAAVSRAGPSDATLHCTSERVQIVFGVDNCQDTGTLLKYSPVSYVSPDDPPFLLLHGALDTSVPPIHSEVFFDRLYEAGVPVIFFKVQNARHVFNPSGREMQPSLEELIQIVISFFNNVMR